MVIAEGEGRKQAAGGGGGGAEHRVPPSIYRAARVAAARDTAERRCTGAEREEPRGEGKHSCRGAESRVKVYLRRLRVVPPRRLGVAVRCPPVKGQSRTRERSDESRKIFAGSINARVDGDLRDVGGGVRD